MIWQLLQVRKLDQTPLVLIGPMWAEFIKWGQQYFLRPEFELAGPASQDSSMRGNRCRSSGDHSSSLRTMAM